MKLVACPGCRTQYDVTQVAAASFSCRCGESVESRAPSPVDRTTQRCASCGAIVAKDSGNCDYCGAQLVRDPGPANLICPGCYARNVEGCRFCRACGIAFEPQPVPVDPIELPCPCCGALMPPRRIGGITVQECGGCHGLWVPGEQFETLVQRAIEARKQRFPLGFEKEASDAMPSRMNPAAQPVAYRKCPVCEAFMNRRNFQRRSGVVIDTCREHGTWLDADELEQIGNFVLSGDLARSQGLDAEEKRAAERSKVVERTVQAHRESLGHSTSSYRSSSAGHTGEDWFARRVVDLFDFLLS